MTVLFAANEDVAFLRSGGATYTSTLAGTFDPLACRCSLYPYVARRLEGTWDASASTFWFQARYWVEDPGNGLHQDAILTFRDGATEVLRLRLPAGEIRVERNDGSWTQIVDTNTFFADETMQRLTIKVVLHASTGAFEMWLDEAKIADFSGDTVGTTGSSTCDGLVLESSHHTIQFSLLEYYVSEVMVDTTDPRAKRVVTLNPTADGNDTAWTGGFGDLDEIELDDTDLITSGTVDQVENYVAADLNAAWSEYFAEEIRLNARALRSSGGPQNIQLHLRSNATNYFSPNISLGLSFAPITYSWTTDPDTAAAWTNAAVDALQIGVKSIT